MYKVQKHSDGTINIFIYLTHENFKHGSHTYLNYTPNFANHIFMKIIENVLHAEPENAKIFNYAQAKISYPLFHQKLETLSRMRRGIDLSQAGIFALRDLTVKLFDDFTKEMNKMPAMHYQVYGEFDGGVYKNVFEKAYSEGEVQLCLKSSTVELKEALLTTYFEQESLCITEDGQFQHSYDKSKYKERNKLIQEARSNGTLKNLEQEKQIHHAVQEFE